MIQDRVSLSVIRKWHSALGDHYLNVITAHTRPQPVSRGGDVHQATLIDRPETPPNCALPTIPMSGYPIQVSGKLIIVIDCIERVQVISERERESRLETERNSRPMQLPVGFLNLEQRVEAIR